MESLVALTIRLCNHVAVDRGTRQIKLEQDVVFCKFDLR